MKLFTEKIGPKLLINIEMGTSPFQHVIHLVTIDTKLKFNRLNVGDGLIFRYV